MPDLVTTGGKDAGSEAAGDTKALRGDDNLRQEALAPEKGSSWFPSGDSRKRSQNDSEELAKKGTIPEVELEDSEKAEEHDKYTESVGFRGWLADTMASEDEKQIFQDYNQLAKELGHEPLTNTQKLQIVHMPEDQKEMYKETLKELRDLQDGKISPSEYMMNTLDNAADLAEKNGRDPDSWNVFKPTQGEKFVNYVGLVMSEVPMGFWKDAGRELVGGGPNISGSALESLYQSVVAPGRANDGFNPNITDTDNSNSITHHFREFLVVGYNAGKTIADAAAATIDSPVKNPGDVRDGYFASMLGSALYKGKISPREAANLTEWAYTAHGGKQPPWGATAEAGTYLDPGKDYKIEDWMKAYRERNK